jgi:F-type H+-transporting ATPase subunit epsilon
MAAENFTLEVVTPQRLVVKEVVAEAQIPVLGGYIGVLPGHTPLLAELGCGELTYRVDNQTRACTAIGGFVEVMSNRVIVLADRSESAEEIDVPRAQAALERAIKRLSNPNDPGIDARRAQDALARAEVRLKTAAHRTATAATAGRSSS